MCHVQLSVGQCAVEVGDGLESHLRDGVHQCGFVIVQLAILHLALQFLLGHQGLLALHFLEALSYLGTRAAGYHHVEPVLLGGLCAAGLYLHLVSTLQSLAYGHVLPSDSCAGTLVAHLRVDTVGKVQDCGTSWEFEEVSLRSEDVNFVLCQVKAELVHQLHVVVRLKGAFHAG